MTECTRRYWAALAAALPGSIFGEADVVAKALALGSDAWYKPGEPHLPFREWAAAAADEELSGTALAALHAAAACDAPLHADGMRRAGVLPLDALGEQPADDDGAWLQAAMRQPSCGT